MHQEMYKANNVDEIADLIKSTFATAGIIGIDGNDGVGKSTLAKELGEVIGAAVFSIDDFVANNLGSYIPNLRAKELQAAVSSASRPLIVEGVCLLNALEVADLKPDLLIYLKRMSNYGHWYDQDECDPVEEEDALIQRLSNLALEFSRLDASLSGKPEDEVRASGLTPLREEIIRYHSRFRPSRNAHIALLRTDA